MLNSIFIAKSLIYGAEMELSPFFLFFIVQLVKWAELYLHGHLIPLFQHKYFFVTLTLDRVHT